jgi:hypothetical protein
MFKYDSDAQLPSHKMTTNVDVMFIFSKYIGYLAYETNMTNQYWPFWLQRYVYDESEEKIW